jgi:hypothetical protein
MSHHHRWVSVESQSIRQMPSGSSFNEVFVTDLTVIDTWRASRMRGNGGRQALVMLSFRAKSVRTK